LYRYDIILVPKGIVKLRVSVRRGFPATYFERWFKFLFRIRGFSFNEVWRVIRLTSGAPFFSYTFSTRDCVIWTVLSILKNATRFFKNAINLYSQKCCTEYVLRTTWKSTESLGVFQKTYSPFWLSIMIIISQLYIPDMDRKCHLDTMKGRLYIEKTEKCDCIIL